MGAGVPFEYVPPFASGSSGFSVVLLVGLAMPLLLVSRCRLGRLLTPRLYPGGGDNGRSDTKSWSEGFSPSGCGVFLEGSLWASRGIEKFPRLKDTGSPVSENEPSRKLSE